MVKQAVRGRNRIRKEAVREINQLKDKKGFLRAGKPLYNHLFGRDSLISAWQLLGWDPGVAKATLEILSELQGTKVDEKREEEPGKIIHETDARFKEHPSRKGFPFPYYGAVDSTPLYLIVFGLYFKKTKDEKFLVDHWHNILLALDWMKEYGDKDGDLFLEYKQHNKHAIKSQCWKDTDKYEIKCR